MRRVRFALGLAAAALTFAAVGLSHGDDGDGLLKDERHFKQQAEKTFQGGHKAGSALNMVVVGHNDLEARGFNADVWVHDGFAYVGQWGFTDWATGNSRFCPTDERRGVAVIDVRDPTNPTRVSTLLNVNGSSAEDVVVYTARFGAFAGRDIAVAGIQDCAGSRYSPDPGDRGLQLWDVTDAADPVPLGMLATACCTRGVHEFEVQHRPDLGRTFAYATVPTSRYPDANTPSGYRDANGDGDFRLIDITDPTHPVQVSDWGIQDIGGPFSAGQGGDPDPNFGHRAQPSGDGRLVFLSYWDSGFIALDVTDPTHPVF